MFYRSLFIYLLVLLLSSCVSNDVKSFQVPGVSLSASQAIEQNVFIYNYDLMIINDQDTTLLSNYSWLEYQWFISNNQDNDLSVSSDKLQLVFPFDFRITQCIDSYKACDFELFDANWNTTGYKGKFFYYRPQENENLSVIKLFVIEEGTRKRTLIFTRKTPDSPN